MTSSRFDPQLDKPFGRCRDCNQELFTEQKALNHIVETRDAKVEYRSHIIHVTNPTRPMLINAVIQNVIEDAVCDVIDHIEEMIQDGDITVEEARSELSHEFLDEFDDRYRVPDTTDKKD